MPTSPNAAIRSTPSVTVSFTSSNAPAACSTTKSRTMPTAIAAYFSSTVSRRARFVAGSVTLQVSRAGRPVELADLFDHLVFTDDGGGDGVADGVRRARPQQPPRAEQEELQH